MAGRPSLPKQMSKEALALAVSLGVALLLGSHMPEPLSSFAYGFGAVVGLALADLGTALGWYAWRRRVHLRTLSQALRPDVHSVVGEAVAGGLCVALARQFGLQHPGALTWVGYGVQAMIVLAVAAIAIWVWWGVRQQRRNNK